MKNGSRSKLMPNQNGHLLKDITSKIFTKILKIRRLEKFLKIGTLL